MLVGLRGVGKTVLLNRFAEIAGDEGVQVGFIEAPESGDFRTLLAVRLRRILLEWNSRVRRAVTTALGVLKSFTLKLPAGPSLSIGVDPLAGRADSGLLAEDLTDVLVAAGEAAAACDSALMVAVDEIQYLSTDELAALVTAIHRTTQLGLPVILTGAGLPQLPALVGAARSYAERLFEFPVVSSLPPRGGRGRHRRTGPGIRGRVHSPCGRPCRDRVLRLPVLPAGMGLSRLERGAVESDCRRRCPRGPVERHRHARP